MHANCRQGWCIALAAAETRSFERGELGERRDADSRSLQALAERPETAPELAVVECDGGRIRTREPGYGRGVHLSGQGWRETKNACLIKVAYQSPRPGWNRG